MIISVNYLCHNDTLKKTTTYTSGEDSRGSLLFTVCGHDQVSVVVSKMFCYTVKTEYYFLL